MFFVLLTKAGVVLSFDKDLFVIVIIVTAIMDQVLSRIMENELCLLRKLESDD